jgi:hypothetical protein
LKARTAVLLRQGLRPAAGDGREGDAVQPLKDRVHVGDDDGEMLEPQVRAATALRIGPARRVILQELHLVAADPHHQRIDDGARHPEEPGHGRVFDMATPDRHEAEPVTI